MQISNKPASYDTTVKATRFNNSLFLLETYLGCMVK